MSKSEILLQIGKYILGLIIGCVIIRQLGEIIYYLKILTNQ